MDVEIAGRIGPTAVVAIDIIAIIKIVSDGQPGPWVFTDTTTLMVICVLLSVEPALGHLGEPVVNVIAHAAVQATDNLA